MANSEHLTKIKQGVKDWNDWRKVNPKVIPDLRGADLRDACLAATNLTRAYLNSRLGTFRCRRREGFGD